MLEVRRLRVEHLRDVIDSIRSVDEFMATDNEDQWSSDELREWLINPSDYCVGVFSNEMLVGYCLSHWHKEVNKVHIENVFVRDDFRRQGVGTALMKAVSKFYAAHAHSRIRLAGVVRSDNRSAQFFFEQDGFQRGQEMIWYQKDLISPGHE